MERAKARLNQARQECLTRRHVAWLAFSELTTDGHLVTTVDQEGEHAGTEIGRIWLLREDGWMWWECRSVVRARNIQAQASHLSAQELQQLIRDHNEALQESTRTCSVRLRHGRGRVGVRDKRRL